MPVIRREDFGTERAPTWAAISGGVTGMGVWTQGVGGSAEPHYHDAEEFWFVLSGKARIMTDGIEAVVEPGDVICTHMGEEHAVMEILEAPYTHVWIECNLRGEKRRGHLHRSDGAGE